MKIILRILSILLILFLHFSCNSVEPDDSDNGIDTTSHNFTFQTWTFGEHSSSVLYDVAIIDENNIWAVGEIYMNDTLGQPDPHPYGLVHWNGSEWNVKRITTQNPSGGYSYIIPTGIFAKSPSEIWLARGGVYLFNGDSITQAYWLVNYSGYNGGIFNNGESASKLWGTSSTNLYTIGTKGAMAHFDGVSWQKIESGSTVGLSDIYGNVNGDIYSCGGNLSTGQGIVLKINNNSVTKIIDSYYYGSGFDSTKMFTENLYGPLKGIWVAENGNVFTVGNFIYRYGNGIWDYAEGIEYNYLGAGEFTGRGFSHDISGEKTNDFIFVGERNTIRYFKGIRAIQIGEPFSYTSEYQWYSVNYKQNTAVTVGKKGGYASVIIFRR